MAATALTLVNRVRARAADPTGWVYTGGATYDAGKAVYTHHKLLRPHNYKVGLYPAGAFTDPVYAMKAIMFERRLEFAMEGQRFFDLVTLGNC